MSRAAAIGLAIAALAPAALAEPPPAQGGEQWIQLDDGQWMRLDESEIIEVFAEREDKPFDRDTELRLSGRELAARGITNLAEALDQIPELYVRRLGRGGLQVNVRGARKAAVKVLIDGVPVDEVFYGTFDVSAIPVTDIAQIRVSTSPASPIDGVGGPGGVIEVHTVDAAGPRLLSVRANGSTLPSADVAATGRSELGGGLSARGSVTASFGLRDFEVAGPSGMEEVAEDRAAYAGALRLEYRRGADRVVADAFTQERGMVVPPGEDGSEDIIAVDGESSTRFGVAADLRRSRWRIQSRVYAQTLDRRMTRYQEPAMEAPGRPEHLSGTRAGLGLLVNRPVGGWHLLSSATLDNESGQLESGSTTTTGQATLGELAAGAQGQLGPVKLDGALGLAVPLGGAGDRPWPEAKLTAAYQPAAALGLELTVARKGRLPTLRERYRPDVGNPELEPELARFVSLGATLTPVTGLELGWTTWVRDSDGVIRFDLDRDRLINVDDLMLRGFDVDLEASLHRLVRAGAAYAFTDSYSPRFGTESLDFLPRHRAETWLGLVTGRWRSRVRLRYLSDQNDQSIVIPARTTVDVSAFARLSSRLEASLRLDNLGGERYLVRRGGTLSPGRVVMLSLQSRL